MGGAASASSLSCRALAHGGKDELARKTPSEGTHYYLTNDFSVENLHLSKTVCSSAAHAFKRIVPFAFPYQFTVPFPQETPKTRASTVYDYSLQMWLELWGPGL